MKQIPLAIELAVIGLMMLALAGCGPVTVKAIEFSCRSYAVSGVMFTDCADEASWRKWDAEQQKKGGI